MTTWAAATAYTVGTRVQPTTANGYNYRCITAGTSGASEPEWPTLLGAQVTDGTAAWACVSAVGSEIQKLAASAIVELFVLDSTAQGGVVSRFHCGTNQLATNVTWQGEQYTPIPLKVAGFEFNGNGKMPRPRLQIANVGGLVSALTLAYGDLLGAKLTRKRTLLKYLDAVNFPKYNLLLWSNRIDNAAWSVASGLTVAYDGTEGATRLTTAVAADPFRGQTITLSPHGRTFRFDVDIKGEGSAIGKTGQLYLYASSPFGELGFIPYTVTGSWQRIGFTHTFGAGTSTQLTARIDPPQTATGGVIGDAILVRDAQVSESSAALDYQETTSSWNPDADPSAEFPDDVYFVDRKSVENKIMVEFELAPAFDVTGVKLPRRQIVQNVCSWTYRSAECSYAGGAVAEADDTPTADINLDRCGKRISSCKLRFGEFETLPYGGFPAAGLVR